MLKWDEEGYELENCEEEASKLDIPDAHHDEGVQDIEAPESRETDIEMAIENLDRFLEDILEHKTPEIEQEVPDVWWAEDIAKIENPIIQKKEIEAAQKWLDKRNERLEEYESGEKDLKYFGADNPDLTRRGIKAATRCALESEGITYEDLGDLSEDARRLQAGDLEFVETKDHVKKMLRDVDPEVDKELAEKVIEEHELSKDDAESLRRLIRLREIGEK